MKKMILILILTLLILLCAAQYDERQILNQEANQHLSRRQYSEAEAIYLQILEKFPADQGAISQLMYIYLALGSGDKAEALINKYQRNLPQNSFTEYRIQLLLMQGKLSEAAAESDNYLWLFPTDTNKYRMIASYYERRNFFDKAIELYQRGREASGKDVFYLEMANAAVKAQLPKLALSEYLAYMSSAQNVNQYVKNQIKGIVEAEPELVQDIADFALGHESFIIQELYAYSLVSIKAYAAALEVYKLLPETYLRSFAYEQLRAGNLEVSLPAMQHLAEHHPQPQQRLSYSLEVAKILYQEARYEQSEEVLGDILADEFWETRPNNRRNPLFVSVRRLLAEIALALGRDFDAVKGILQDTQQYASQAQTRQELELEMARLSILEMDFAKAESSLNSVNIGAVLPQRDYLRFLSRFFEGKSAEADSVMHEFMLRHPGHEKANDIIYLNMLSINLNEKAKKSFAGSVLLLQKMNTAGVDSLYSVFLDSEDEELLILAIEWAIGLGQSQKARLYLEHIFTDPLSAEYASWLRLALLSDPDQELELAKSFLKHKPNSIFSPGFRQVISQAAAGRLNL